MLRSKIIHLKETYKFGFDNFLEKCTDFILIKKKEIYNFGFDHFLIKRTVFVLIVKNVIKNQKFNFPDKLCDIRNKC